MTGPTPVLNEAWSLALEQAPAVVYVKGLDHRYLFVNRMFERLMHQERRDVLGRADDSIFGAAASQARLANERRVWDSHAPLSVEETLSDDAGNEIRIAAIKYPLFTAEAGLIGLCSIGNLVAVSGSAEVPGKGPLRPALPPVAAGFKAELAHLPAPASEQGSEQLHRVKDEFLATLSHELRTPLNAILGWSQLLLSGELEPEKISQALQIIERNARMEARLVEDLLDVSHIVRGNLRLDVAAVDMNHAMEAACDAVRLAAEARGVVLAVAKLSKPVQVRGDAKRLQQLIWNLVSNAIKFTPRDGSVRVALALGPAVLRLSVTDTGVGIRPAFLPHVFERFRQADSSFSRSFGGLGLGLAIVRELAELHGGTVQAESQGEGLGATFTVVLPIAEPYQGQAPLPVHTPDHGVAHGRNRLTNIRVLVADADADARELVTTVLRLYKAEVREARTPLEALELLRQWDPDVLVSDLGQPGSEGFDFIHWVRAQRAENGGKVAAIALSSYAHDAARHQAIMAGYQMHMAKPLAPEVLVNSVAALARSANGL